MKLTLLMTMTTTEALVLSEIRMSQVRVHCFCCH